MLLEILGSYRFWPLLAGFSGKDVVFPEHDHQLTHGVVVEKLTLADPDVQPKGDQALEPPFGAFMARKAGSIALRAI